MNVETAQAGAPLTRVLDAAESLFYARGVQSVGMDEVRAASGVSLKRLYQLFPSKGDLVEAYLRRRDARWLDRLAVCDWLHLWFGEPDFRGCAFVNAFGELGATSAAVAEAVRDHKAAFRRYLADLVSAAGLPAALAGQLTLLAEGAMTSSAISGSTEPAGQARDAARVLIEAARSGASGSTGPEGR
jgi:AcrR family transcriptional regulator